MRTWLSSATGFSLLPRPVGRTRRYRCGRFRAARSIVAAGRGRSRPGRLALRTGMRNTWKSGKRCDLQSLPCANRQDQGGNGSQRFRDSAQPNLVQFPRSGI